MVRHAGAGEGARKEIRKDVKNRMKRPNQPWWGYAKSMVKRYPDRVDKAEKAAVEGALQATRDLDNGETRIKMIELVYFKRTHTLKGAAVNLYYSYGWVKQWHAAFIKLVWDNFEKHKKT